MRVLYAYLTTMPLFPGLAIKCALCVVQRIIYSADALTG